MGAALASSAILFPLSVVHAAPAAKTNQLTAELSQQIAALKAEMEERLKAQEAEARKREEEARKQNTAEVEKVRRETAEQTVQQRNEWQAANQSLQDALKAAISREDAREKNAPPSVGAQSAGIRLHGYVQSDLQIRQSSQDQLNPTSGEPLNNDRFMIRRARLLVDVERTYVEGGLEFDGNTVNGVSARILGARASLKWPGQGDATTPLLMVSMGSLRIPFGAELLETDRERPFMERSIASRAFFASEFDLGVRVQARWRFVRCALALMNGEPLEGSKFPGLDPNRQKDVVGRLGVDTGQDDFAAAGGISALYGTGFRGGSTASKPVVRWIDMDGDGKLNPNSETSATTASAATASRNFKHFGFNADLSLRATLVPHWWFVGATTIRAELTWGQNLDRALVPADPYGELKRDSRELGYTVGVTQVFLRYGIAGVRFDYYDPDRDRYIVQSGDLVPSDLSFHTWSFMVGLISPWGRLLFQYDLNRNHLGLTAGALPGNLADNAFNARAEVIF